MGRYPKKKIPMLVIILFVFTTMVVHASNFYSLQEDEHQMSLTKTIDAEKGASNELILVNIIKWCQDGTFKSEITKIPKSQYIEYTKEIKSCKTVEEAFVVLQKYGIVPKDKSLDDLKTIIENSKLLQILKQKILKLKRGLEGDRTKMFAEDFLCLVSGTIKGPFSDFYIPIIFYYTYSDFGGSISAICYYGAYSESGDIYFDMSIVGWLGVFTPPLIQFFTPYDVTFQGIALYMFVDVY